ncbi:MAG: MoaD/ThiS family protein [Syntrophorhabdales bacterium]|jgi:sulfur carrier protein ThiS
MKIHVAIDPLLLEYAAGSAVPFRAGEWEVSDGTTVAEIVTSLSFPEGTEILTMVNDVCYLDKKRLIRDGDYVSLLPLIAGG